MKNYLKFMLTAFVLMAVVSCAKEEVADPNPENGVQENVTLVPMTITVVGDDSAKSGLKTDVADNLTSVVWCEDDEIAVFDKGGNKQRFEIVSYSGNTAVFEGQVEEGTTDFYAVYPYEAAESCNVSSREIVANALSSQTLSESGKVAPGALLTLAKGKRGEPLVFKHALGLIRFDITRGDVSEIYLDGTALAGKATFSFDAEGNPEVKSVDEASETVALSGSFVEGGSYFIPVLPGTTETGNFHITIVTADGNGLVATHPGSVTVPRKGGFHLEDRNTNFTESFLIKDAATLKTFLADAKNYVAGQHATIIKDIDLTGETITSAASFKGILNGRNHSIKNWTSQGVSLFTTYSGTVKNLVLDATCKLTPATNIFGFIANRTEPNSLLENCINNAPINLETATFSGEAVEGRIINDIKVNVAAIGSLVGKNEGTVRNCINNGNITINVSGTISVHVHLGGIAGYADLTSQIAEGETPVAYENCINNGNISYDAQKTAVYAFIGGVSGGTDVSSVTDTYAGYRGALKKCKNLGKISYTLYNSGTLVDGEGKGGTNNYTKFGGVVGYWEGDIEGCVNGEMNDSQKGALSFQAPTSDTNAAMSAPSFGGVAAYVMYNMKDCVNYGPLYMKGTFAGGTQTNMGTGVNGTILAGGVVAQAGTLLNPENYLISNCHNYGEIYFHLGMAHTNGTEANAAGVVGYANTKISNCSNNATITIEGKCHMNRYAGVAGQLRYAGDNLTNNGVVNIKTIRSVAGTPDTQYKQCSNGAQQFAGVVAYTVNALTSITNNKAVNLTIEAADTNNGQVVVGGAVGRTTHANVSAVKNEGAVTVNHASSSKGAVVAGALAWVNTAVVDEVGNSGAVVYNGNTQNSTVYAGGGIAHSEAVEIKGISNTASVTVNAAITTLRFGGLVGNAPKATNISGSNSGDLNATVTSCTNAYVGGVVGHVNAATTVNATNGGDMSCAIQGTNTYLGGIAGYINAAASITATNNGAITMTKVPNSPRTAGIVGTVSKASTFTNCRNNSSISVSTESTVSGQFYLSGICAFTETSSTFKGCINAGDLTFSAPSCSATSNSYISGICQSSSTKQYYDTCQNTGDITLDCVTNAARIGGMAGYNADGGYFRNCTAEMNITISKKVNGTVNAGGIAGYCNPCEFTTCSYSGNINVKGKGNTAGILGAGNNNALTMKGCTVNAKISGNGEDTFAKGLFIGYVASKSHTLGVVDNPCKVIAGTQINGETITSSNLSTYLVGSKGTGTVDGTYTSVVEK